MDISDWNEISARVATAWPDARMSDDRARVYFEALRDLDAETVRRAVDDLIREGHETCPAPGVIRDRATDRAWRSPALQTPPPVVVPAPTSSGKAVAALVLGIVGLVAVPIICSTLAIIFGAIARGEIERNSQLSGMGMATAGLVMGIVGLALGLLFLILIIGAA